MSEQLIEEEILSDPERDFYSDRFCFKVDKATLLKALSHTQNIVERKNTIEIIGNVRLDAYESILEITATDLEIQVAEKIAVEVISPGSVTLPAHKLYDIIRKLPDESMVTIGKLSETQVQITSCNCKFSLPFLNAKDFPVITSDEATAEFVIEVKDLAKIIDKTKFAISTEETRYYLNGIYLHKLDGENMIRAVATDGHRMAYCNAKISSAPNFEGVIIPRKAVNEIYKIALDNVDSKVTIKLSEAKIVLKFDNLELISKLVDGSYPNYESVIPRENHNKIVLKSQEFKNSVERVSIISNERNRGIKVSAEGKYLKLDASGDGAAHGQEEISLQKEVEKIESAFNSKYLIEMMGVIEGDEIEIAFSEALVPAIIKDKSDDSCLFIIMPMRA